MKIIILVPVYNDYKSVSKLINEINSIVSGLNLILHNQHPIDYAF